MAVSLRVWPFPSPDEDAAVLVVGVGRDDAAALGLWFCRAGVHYEVVHGAARFFGELVLELPDLLDHHLPVLRDAHQRGLQLLREERRGVSHRDVPPHAGGRGDAASGERSPRSAEGGGAPAAASATHTTIPPAASRAPVAPSPAPVPVHRNELPADTTHHVSVSPRLSAPADLLGAGLSPLLPASASPADLLGRAEVDAINASLASSSLLLSAPDPFSTAAPAAASPMVPTVAPSTPPAPGAHLSRARQLAQPQLVPGSPVRDPLGHAPGHEPVPRPVTGVHLSTRSPLPPFPHKVLPGASGSPAVQCLPPIGGQGVRIGPAWPDPRFKFGSGFVLRWVKFSIQDRPPLKRWGAGFGSKSDPQFTHGPGPTERRVGYSIQVGPPAK